MKLLFKNRTKYTKEIYNNFLIFHNNHYKYSYTLYTAIISFSILFLICFQVKIHNTNISIILCAVLAIFIFWRIFHPILKVSKEYKSDKIQNAKEYTFKFYEKKFTVEDNTTISHSKYSNLYKIFETESFFYLYIDRTHSLLLEKDRFIKGNSEEFSNFIKKKCWYKYKCKEKKQDVK